MFQTPNGFSCVEPGFYRADRIDVECLPFLCHLRIKKVVQLNAGQISRTFASALEECGFELKHIGFQPWRSGTDLRVFSLKVFEEAFKCVTNKHNYPILVLDSTHVFVGMFRKFQNWAYSAVLAEYVAFSGKHSQYTVSVLLELLEVKAITESERRELEDDTVTNIMPSELVVVLPERELMPDWLVYQLDVENSQRLQQTEGPNVDT